MLFKMLVNDSFVGRHSLDPAGVVMPYKPQGPDPFPVRIPKQPLEVKQECILPDDSYYYKEPEFWCVFTE